MLIQAVNRMTGFVSDYSALNSSTYVLPLMILELVSHHLNAWLALGLP